GNDSEPCVRQAGGECARVFYHLLLILHEFGSLRFSEAHRLRGYHMDERPALNAREHRLIHSCRVLLAAENNTRARPAERFMSRGGGGYRVTGGVLEAPRPRPAPKNAPCPPGKLPPPRQLSHGTWGNRESAGMRCRPPRSSSAGVRGRDALLRRNR